jgi:hypothetical protein
MSHSDLDELLEQHATASAKATWQRWPAEATETLRELHRRHHDTNGEYFGRITLATAQRVLNARHDISATVYHIETWARAHGLARWSDPGGK